MDFESLVQATKEQEIFALRQNSISTHQNYLKLYQKQFSNIEGAPDPFPITEDKIRAFIEYSVRIRTNPITYATVKCFVNAFTWYFKNNNMIEVTKTTKFKQYIKSLRVSMQGDTPPHRKEPFLPDHLKTFALKVIDNKNDIMKMSLYSIMFYGFLRVSELKNLLRSDVNIEEDKTIVLTIRSSKTDPTGKGIQTFIPYIENPPIYHPYTWLVRYLADLKISSNDPLFAQSKQTIERYAKQLAKLNGLNPANYSSHSFRRGGAHTASSNGIQDCQIQKHGRWSSTCYLMYTSVARREAGTIIALALS